MPKNEYNSVLTFVLNGKTKKHSVGEGYMGTEKDNDILDGVDWNTVPEIDRTFLMFSFKTIRNEEFRKDNKNHLMLYMYLCAYIVRKPMDDGLYICQTYYWNDTLACSMPYSRLSAAFGVGRNTIIRWIETLENKGLLRIEKINIDKYRKQNVYILGTHSNYNECLFMREIYN